MTEDDRPGVAIFPPLLFGICLLYGLAVHWIVPYRFGLPAWARVAGGIVAASGLALAQWGKRTMEAAGTNVRPDQPALSIVSAGPFAHTRNPLYLGVMGLFAGVGVALDSPAFLTGLVPLFLVLRIGVVAREERYLEAKFGDAYRAYRSRVRRWI